MHKLILDVTTTAAATSALEPAVENKILKKLTPVIAIPPIKNTAKTNSQYLTGPSTKYRIPGLKTIFFFSLFSFEESGLFRIRINKIAAIMNANIACNKKDIPKEDTERTASTIEGRKIPDKLLPEVAIPRATLDFLPNQLSSNKVIPDAPPKLYPIPVTTDAAIYNPGPFAKENIKNPQAVIKVATEIPILQSSFLYHIATKNIVIKLDRHLIETTIDPYA